VKEIISAVLVIVGIWGGTRVLGEFYDTVRKAALEKASQGLPSLGEMNHQLHRSKPSPPVSRKRDSQSKEPLD
jgi:hypothetical protein